MNKPREKWYRQNGAEGDVVISTRVRLARNLTGVPFPASMNPEQKQSVVEAVCAALQPVEETFQLADMGKLSPRDALSLVERHLISPELDVYKRQLLYLFKYGPESAVFRLRKQVSPMAVHTDDQRKVPDFQPLHRLATQVFEGNDLAGNHAARRQSPGAAHCAEIHRSVAPDRFHDLRRTAAFANGST